VYGGIIVKARSISAINSPPVRHAIHARLHRNVVTHASSRGLFTCLANSLARYYCMRYYVRLFTPTQTVFQRCCTNNRSSPSNPFPSSSPPPFPSLSSPTRRRLSLTPRCQAHSRMAIGRAALLLSHRHSHRHLLQPNSYRLQTASHEHIPGTKDASCASPSELRSRGSIFPNTK
jgi:hypothetical protein